MTRPEGDPGALYEVRVAVEYAARRAGGASVRYLVAFHLSDGTSSIRGLFPTANILAPAIHVPAAFTSAIEAAVGMEITPGASPTGSG